MPDKKPTEQSTTKQVGLHTPGPWTPSFNQHAGYDMMTGGWHIYAGPDMESRTVAIVDQAAYGQRHCDYDFRSPQAACRNGHPRTTDNVYIAPDGSRVCRVCNRGAVAKYKSEHQ